MAAIVEGHHDDKSIIWPIAVAPFHVAVVVAQSNDPAVAGPVSGSTSGYSPTESRSSSTTVGVRLNVSSRYG